MDIYAQLEAKRKSACKATVITIALFVLAFICFFFFFPLGIVLAAAGLIYLFAVTRVKDKEHKSFFKNNVVKAVLEEFLTNVDYKPNEGIAKEIIENTEMMSMGNTYSSNDFISAEYNTVPFYQADVTIQQITHTGKSTNVITYFQGRWFVFEFNKPFASDMQIREKSFSYAKTSGGLFAPKEEKFKKIEFEDADFNSTFVTKARDEHEAFYIVTPQFMQYIKEFNNAVKGDLLLCFIDGKLHLGLNNGSDAFEVSVFEKTDPEQIRKSIVNDISVITQFVDRLRLDNDLFK